MPEVFGDVVCLFQIGRWFFLASSWGLSSYLYSRKGHLFFSLIYFLSSSMAFHRPFHLPFLLVLDTSLFIHHIHHGSGLTESFFWGKISDGSWRHIFHF